MNQELNLNIRFKVHKDADQLPDDYRSLVKESIKAAERAYAPYSNFQVGAAVLLESGEVITGNNQENAAYPSGLCAERVAVFAASSLHPGKTIRAVAVFARGKDSSYEEPVTPCGACRQALLEYENKQKSQIPMFMTGINGKIIEAESVVSLLPLAFGSFQLKGNQ